MLQAGGSGRLDCARQRGLARVVGVLPGLLFGYLWQSRAARRTGTTFALRKSEAAELDRALAAYAKICRRIEDIGEQPRGIRGLWRELLGRSNSRNDERDDLQAHAEHVRESIGRLRRRPLQRLKTWIHVGSAQFALGQTLAVYVVGLTLMLLAAFRVSGVSAWAAEFSTAADNALVWYPFDARLFYANAAATAFAVAAAPLFYLRGAPCCAGKGGSNSASSKIWPILTRPDRPKKRNPAQARHTSRWPDTGRKLATGQPCSVFPRRDDRGSRTYKTLISRTIPIGCKACRWRSSGSRKRKPKKSTRLTGRRSLRRAATLFTAWPIRMPQRERFIAYIACPKCSARLMFHRSSFPLMDSCGFESYSLECDQCGVQLVGVIDPLDDRLLLSELES